MSNLVLELSAELAGYVASALAVGNDEDASETEREAVERIEKALSACSKGVRITVEPIE